MRKIKLFLTFDYELPLGGIKESYEHSLFKPTKLLIKVLKEINVNAVFFIDILSLKMFQSWGVPVYSEPFIEQVKELSRLNHDIQLHLHPHWLESRFQKNQVIQSPKYKLGDFHNDSSTYTIDNIVEMGINQLRSICQDIKNDYKCIAYRAGGYNFYPYTKEIWESLYRHGIRIDSSISPGYFFRSNVSTVDYRIVPKKSYWSLSRDGSFKTEGKKDDFILEIPIASKPKGLFEMPTAFKLKKYEHRAVEDRGRMIHSSEEVSSLDKIRQLFSSRMLTIDNHTFEPDYLLKILDYNIRKSKSTDIMLSLIGHPKSLDSYHYSLLTDFVDMVKAKYGEDVEFCTFSQVYDELEMN